VLLKLCHRWRHPALLERLFQQQFLNSLPAVEMLLAPRYQPISENVNTWFFMKHIFLQKRCSVPSHFFLLLPFNCKQHMCLNVRFSMLKLCLGMKCDVRISQRPIAINFRNLCYSTTGEQYMETQGISYSDWDRWSNIVALAGMCVIFLLLAYIALRRISKYK